MKINANEMLLINKNLKFKGDETEPVSNPNASLTEVPEGEEESTALKAQAMNNIAFQGVNIAGMKKMGLNAMLALSLLAGAASMSSCTTEEGDAYFTVNNTVTTHLTVNTYMTDEELVKAVLDEIKALREDNKKQAEINQAILAELMKQGISLDRILTLLEKMNMTAEDILNMLKENSDKQDAILNTITNGNQEQKELMLQILDAVNHGNKLSADNNKTLTMILVQMGKADQYDKETIAILNMLLSKVNESIQTQKAIAAKQTMLMQAILGKLSCIDNNMKEGILAILNKIDAVSEANIELLTKIFNTVDENNKNDKLTNDILMAIYNKVDESIKQNHDLTEKTHEMLWMLMDKLSSMDDNMKQGVLAILKHIDTASAANIELLIKLINKVDTIGSNDNESAKILNQILAEIRIAIEQNKDVDSRTQALLQSILDNMQNFNADLKTAVAQLLAKMDQMSAEHRDFCNQILSKLDNMDNNAKAGLAMLIKQMAENNTLTQMQLNKLKVIIDKLDKASEADQKFYNQAIALLSELLSKVDKLGNKADSILDAIGNISLDANVDLSTIEKMLADILAQSKANGDVLTSIDGKMNLVAITLEGIKSQLEEMGGDHKAIIARLDAILAKIPEGCKCDASLTVIIEKLDKIIQEIKNGNNHEGILDDLENMFQ